MGGESFKFKKTMMEWMAKKKKWAQWAIPSWQRILLGFLFFSGLDSGTYLLSDWKDCIKPAFISQSHIRAVL